MGACGLAGPMRTAEKKVRKMYGGSHDPFCQPFSQFGELFIYMASEPLFISTEKFEIDSSEDADDTFCELTFRTREIFL